MANTDAIIDIVRKITQKKEPPCKKTLQKIVFLIEAKGTDLGFGYGIHFYGPYSADLDFAVREMNAEGLLQIEYTPMEHRISANTKAHCSSYPNDTIDDVINEFGKDTPTELELLTTALYVYLASEKDRSKIKDGVKKIKGAKFGDHRISQAIRRLEKTGYIV